jgi:hypothetical protein
MPFVGRERELERLAAALEAGRNVVLSGNYGMGRTALVRRLGELAPDRFRLCFADFSDTPAAICRSLAPMLPARRRARRRGSLPRARRQRSVTRAWYHSLAAALARASWPAPPLTVLVLDGLAKLTPAKLALLKLLAGNASARWVVIVERFLPRRDLARATAWLYPVERLHVGRLPPGAAREYFRLLCEEHALGWTEEDVRAMARGSGGYPLAMRLAGDRALGRSGSRSSGPGGGQSPPPLGERATLSGAAMESADEPRRPRR